MAGTYLEIYSVVGCDMNFETDDGDVKIYRLEFRNYSIADEAEEVEEGIYKVESELGDEHTGSLKELFELHQDGEEIFTFNDIEDEKCVYDKEVHEEPPIDDDDYEIYWDREEFFINKEEALQFYKKKLNIAKEDKCDVGRDNGLISYYSKPR